MHNNFSHLVPDYEDSREDILASFPSIRSKTLETLYDDGHDDNNDVSSYGGNGPPPRRVDKSPKGSVDEAIQDLVNLINAHPSFSTLSSCSGRIALFDPLLARTWSSASSTGTNTTTQSQEHENDDNGNGDARPAVTKSGKGGTGGWLLASHEVVEPTILVDLLQKNNNDHQDHVDDNSSDDDDNVLSFKMEPLLLHVAAANLTRGRQLLQIALQAAGLRESGLVVTESRVTVALRGQSLALCVPLTARSQDLRPNDEYLVALVHQANRRLQRNFEKITRLFEAVLSQIFRPNDKSLEAPAVATCRIRASPLPALNLWRHASVIAPSLHFSRHALEPKREANDEDHHQEEEEMELLVFGGYGTGPIILDNNGNHHEDGVNSTTSPTRRSDKVYRLRRNLNGSWSEAWEEVIVISTTNNSENDLDTNQQAKTTELVASSSSSSTGTAFRQNCLGLKVRNVAFSAREGLAACLLSVSSSSSSSSSSKDIIALFGGRQGPNRPLNDLLFFDNTQHDNNGSIQHYQSFQAPIDVRGTPPSERWGHSFTAISSPESNDTTNNSRRGSREQLLPLALVVGGRNDSQTFASVHVLSIVVGVEANEMNGQESSDSHLVWTEVMESANHYCRPRFYHAAAMASHNQTFVFGGLWNAQNLWVAGDNKQQDDTTGLVVDTTLASAVSIEPLLCKAPFDNLFGHSVYILPGESSSSSGTTYLSIGGIPRVSHDKEDDDAYLPIRCVTLKTPTAPPSDSTTTSCCSQIMDMRDKQHQKPKGSWIVQEHSVEFVDDNDDYNNNNNNNNSERRRHIAINLGCLVHHSCNVARTRRSNINNEFQLLVVGGGVQGFAFGPIFGKSHLLTVSLSQQGLKSSSRRGDPTTTSNTTADNSSLVERRATGHDVKGRNNGNTFIQHQNGQHYNTRERMKAPTASNGDNNEQQQQQQHETNVLYVTKQDAKMVKTLLEEAHFLDKEYRMGPAAEDVATTHLMTAENVTSPPPTTSLSLLIAVPVTPDCLNLLLVVPRKSDGDSDGGPPCSLADALQPLVQGSGRQVMSFSSSVFAARAQRRKKNACSYS